MNKKGKYVIGKFYREKRNVNRDPNGPKKERKPWVEGPSNTEQRATTNSLQAMVRVTLSTTPLFVNNNKLNLVSSLKNIRKFKNYSFKAIYDGTRVGFEPAF